MTFILLGSNICARHNLMFNTIGVLPEETSAYNLIIWLICSSHSCLLLLTIIEMICFFLYNSKYHPFKMILQIEGIRRLMVNLWHNDTPWGKYAKSQGEVSPGWLTYTSWFITYASASWGMNWPISVYLTLRHGIFASWGILMPQVNNGPNDTVWNFENWFHVWRE